MDFHFDLPSLILLLAMGIFTVLFLPWQREARFRVRRVIAAPREALWDAYQVDLDDPENAALHKTVVSQEVVSRDPEIIEQRIARKCGRQQNYVMARMQTLEDNRPARYATRVFALDQKVFPFGENNEEAFELAEAPGGTQATLSFRGEVGNLFQNLCLFFNFRRYLKNLQRFCEDGTLPADPASPARRFWIAALISFVFFAGLTRFVG